MAPRRRRPQGEADVPCRGRRPLHDRCVGRATSQRRLGPLRREHALIAALVTATTGACDLGTDDRQGRGFPLAARRFCWRVGLAAARTNVASRQLPGDEVPADPRSIFSDVVGADLDRRVGEETSTSWAPTASASREPRAASRSYVDPAFTRRSR